MNKLIFVFALVLISADANAWTAWKDCVPGSFAPGGCDSFAPGGGKSFAPGGGQSFAPGGGKSFAPGGGQSFAPGGGRSIAPGGGQSLDRDYSRGLDPDTLEPYYDNAFGSRFKPNPYVPYTPDW